MIIHQNTALSNNKALNDSVIRNYRITENHHRQAPRSTDYQSPPKPQTPAPSHPPQQCKTKTGTAFVGAIINRPSKTKTPVPNQAPRETNTNNSTIQCRDAQPVAVKEPQRWHKTTASKGKPRTESERVSTKYRKAANQCRDVLSARLSTIPLMRANDKHTKSTPYIAARSIALIRTYLERRAGCTSLHGIVLWFALISRGALLGKEVFFWNGRFFHNHNLRVSKVSQNEGNRACRQTTPKIVQSNPPHKKMNKPPPPQLPIRSSAAEYLTFIAASGEGGVEAIYANENVWLTQKMMGTLYDVETHTVNHHLKTVFADSELDENSVTRKFRITAADGKNYNTNHYNLPAVIAVGYKVNSERAVQFRKWATAVIEQYTIKAYVMDDERLKNDGTILGKQYFEEQLQRIREIRMSERKFYQKITDIYATSIDYDTTAQVTKRFFATVQNKLHWAIHEQTAAELIYNRANAEKTNMGLSTWKDAPRGKIQKFDVSVAKNYLTDSELAQLERLVTAYLDVAESMAIRKIPMTMQDWEERLNRFIHATDRNILSDAGKVTAEIAQQHAESEFEKYRIVQDRLYESDFDRVVKKVQSTQNNLPAPDGGGDE